VLAHGVLEFQAGKQLQHLTKEAGGPYHRSVLRFEWFGWCNPTLLQTGGHRKPCITKNRFWTRVVTVPNFFPISWFGILGVVGAIHELPPRCRVCLAWSRLQHRLEPFLLQGPSALAEEVGPRGRP